LVRPCVLIPLATGDVHAFVSAIGYRYRKLSLDCKINSDPL
jgi:hypothetical protein